MTIKLCCVSVIARCVFFVRFSFSLHFTTTLQQHQHHKYEGHLAWYSVINCVVSFVINCKRL